MMMIKRIYSTCAMFALLYFGAAALTAQESPQRMAKIQAKNTVFVASKERAMPDLVIARDNETQVQGRCR